MSAPPRAGRGGPAGVGRGALAVRKARPAAFPAPCWWREARAEATPRQTPAPPSDRICVVSQAAALTLPSDGPAEPDHPPPQPRLVPLPRFLPRARAPRDFHAAYAFTLVCLACGHTYVCEFPWCCMRWPWSTHTHTSMDPRAPGADELPVCSSGAFVTTARGSDGSRSPPSRAAHSGSVLTEDIRLGPPRRGRGVRPRL